MQLATTSLNDNNAVSSCSDELIVIIYLIGEFDSRIRLTVVI